MATETERKFLTLNDDWKKDVTKTIDIAQGYLSRDPARTVRVRIAGDASYITIKGEKIGMTAPEFEYEIPKKDAQDLLKMCLPGAITKTRHHVPHKGHTWEVDVFEDENKGLIIAEIELSSEEEAFEKPSWAGKDVTTDNRYANANLSTAPYTGWQKKTDCPKP